ncbi:MAG TPA: cupredoxin domain-containing protein [Pyrinomonadaceae bacterium]|nr:cupredoxin domain-containing protein [Pyrinomonadaceae bacterium]HMP64077.1 cupredoxin domain-containing protein [Pyrinomonadaceae bacterium]
MKDHLNKKLRRTALLVAMLAAVFLAPTSADAQSRKSARSQSAKVVIGNYGYDPASIRLKRGVPAKVTFLRVSESTCATEVLFADYGIRRELPLNQAVIVSFTPRKTGEFAFTCGMNMHRGKLIIS